MFKTKRLFNVHFQKEKEYVISVDVYGLCVLEKKTFALKSKPKVLRKKCYNSKHSESPPP